MGDKITFKTSKILSILEKIFIIGAWNSRFKYYLNTNKIYTKLTDSYVLWYYVLVSRLDDRDGRLGHVLVSTHSCGWIFFHTHFNCYFSMVEFYIYINISIREGLYEYSW